MIEITKFSIHYRIRNKILCNILWRKEGKLSDKKTFDIWFGSPLDTRNLSLHLRQSQRLHSQHYLYTYFTLYIVQKLVMNAYILHSRNSRSSCVIQRPMCMYNVHGYE